MIHHTSSPVAHLFFVFYESWLAGNACLFFKGTANNGYFGFTENSHAKIA